MGEEGRVGGLPSMDYEEVVPGAGYAERDFVDHRQVFIGLHHRPGGEDRTTNIRKKLPRFPAKVQKAFHWENGKKKLKQCEDSGSEAEGQDQLSHTAPASERVKFILGGDGGEEEKPVLETPQLFTELEELFVCLDGNAEWKETARWYRYEEDVEEGGDRWSKPHVATLSLYSLFELRSSLMAGTVILDMEATTLDEISDSVLDNLISCNKLDKNFRQKVKETLLCKHRHHRSAGFRRNLSNIMSTRKSFNNSSTKIPKNNSSTTNGFHDSNHTVTNNADVGHTDPGAPVATTPSSNIKLFRNYSQPAFPNSNNGVNKTQHTHQSPPVIDRSLSMPQGGGSTPSGNLVYQHDAEEETMENKTPAFLKRLPSNAEASNVLVGEVDFLEKPIAAFIRLSNSCIIDDLTEVPIPTRFVFVMLGPAVSQGRYHEIGRAISTLMADDIFHDVVYKAKCREDLIAGIDEFLEQVTVLPPGEWDPSIRLDPRLYHNHHHHHTSGPRSRRIAFEPKLEPSMENSDKWSEGNNDGGSSSENSHSLSTTNKLFQGVQGDFSVWRHRQRDYKDGFNFKCVGTGLFMYFLMLAVISTIGENERMSSGGLIGTREHLMALFISGILFAVFSGQPLLVLSFSLPLALMDGILYTVCKQYGIDFLAFRMMIGIWAVVLLVVFVAVNLSSYLKFFTRFSLEIFVVVPALVLLGYGFAHMCYMIRDYAALPGTFANETCQCVRTIMKPFNTTSAPMLVINGTTTVAAATTASIKTTLQAPTTVSLNNMTTVLMKNATTKVSSLINASDFITTTAASNTILQQITTTGDVVNKFRLETVVQHGIHFRDCIQANGMSLEGGACMHGVYPFTSILTVSSIVLLFFLTSFQHLGYLPKQVHQFFHNFAALIVVIALSASANQFNINIRFLNIPASFAPNGIERTQWIVDPLSKNEGWTIILAVIPAILLAFTIYIEQQLCGRQINNHYALLKKGHGYHLDIAVVCVCLFISAAFGLPFCVASIVLSINNVQSLTTKTQADFIGSDVKIKEQRLSTLIAYILVALTPTMRPILRYIPFAVLYGLFITALFKTFVGTQFKERFTLLFMPKEKQPDMRYLRQVPLISVNIFTLSQVVLTVLLCVVRGTAAVLVFPFFVILLIGARVLMQRILPMRDIMAMDEPLPSFRQCAHRLCCFFQHSKTAEVLQLESVEKGALLADECHHDDVLHDTNKDLDRVNLSEELSKTATWKQLTYAEMKKSNSPNASPNAGGDATDGNNKKRRRKRSRTANNKPPTTAAVNNKEISTPPSLSMTNDAKLHPVEHSEFLAGATPASHHHSDNETEGVPPLAMQPWMTVAGEETGGTIGYEDDPDSAISVREKHLNNLTRQGSMDRPPHLTMSSRQNSTLEGGSSNRLKHLPRQSSDERNPTSSSSSSFKRQQRTNKDRSERGAVSSSSSSKRHDSSKKERKHSSHKGPKAGSHNHGHHNHKQQQPQVEEIALPPWEQPYHSPPRKDLGLLHAPTDDLHLTLPDVDPASVKVDDAAPNINDTVVGKTTLNDECSVLLTDIDNNDNCRRKDSVLSSDTPTTSRRYPNFNDSGDASAELD